MFNKTIAAATLVAVSIFSTAFAVNKPLTLTVNGGANFMSLSQSSGGTDVTRSNDTGYAVGVAIDYKIIPDLRLGVSYDFLDNADSSINGLDYNQSVILANLNYDFNNLMHNITPYIGLGLGYDHLSSSKSSGSFSIANSASGFAWRVDVGANYNINQDFGIGLGYRYTGASVSNDNSNSVIITNSSIVGALSYHFAS